MRLRQWVKIIDRTAIAIIHTLSKPLTATTDREKLLQLFLDGHFVDCIRLSGPQLSVSLAAALIGVGYGLAPTQTSVVLGVLGIAIALPVAMSFLIHAREIVTSLIPWRWRTEWYLRREMRRLAHNPWRF